MPAGPRSSEPLSARMLRVAGVVVVLAALWVSFLSVPGPQSITIDSSWHLILAEALREGWQAGVDYVYTYGPLGYLGLRGATYDPALFGPAFVANAVAAAVLAWVFLVRARRLRGQLERIVFLVLLGGVVAVAVPGGDALYLLAIPCLALPCMRPATEGGALRRAAPLAAALAALAWIALVKFTWLLLAALAVAGIALVLLGRGRPALAAAAGGGFGAWFLAGWIAAGQSPGNLPAYLGGSLHLALGYTEGMSLPADGAIAGWALLTAALAAAWTIATALARPRGLSRLASGALVLAGLFLAWKAGFVRYDAAHASVFFGFAMIAPFVVGRPREAPDTARRRRLLWGAVLAAVIGMFWVGQPYGFTPGSVPRSWWARARANVIALVEPGEARGLRDRMRATIADAETLPAIREAAGDASVDIFPSSQGLLLLNDLEYRPRPVVQGHLAYSPRLLEWNADAYLDPSRAPDFVILAIGPIDRRFPTHEDSRALAVLLRDYRPLLVDRGYLLMRRPAEPGASGPPAVTPLATRDLVFGEELDVSAWSDGPLVAAIDLRKTLPARVAAALYQLPPVYLETTADDGITRRHRIVPGMSGAPFLVDPLVLDQNDLLRWFDGRPLKRLRSLRVLRPVPWRPYRMPLTIELGRPDFAPRAPAPAPAIAEDPAGR